MNEKFIQKLTAIVEKNMANQTFGVNDLAREMEVSHSTLHRKIKLNLNKTCRQFIREVRLNKAKELIMADDCTISEISYQVGFGSPSYFSKCFHEHFGHAPGEFKNLEESELLGAIRSGKFRKRNSTLLFLFLIFFALTFLAAGIYYLALIR